MENNISVLVIDDDISTLNLVEHHLMDDGFDVYTADNGNAGLKLAKSRKPSIILLDIIMPNTTGLEVLMELKKNHTTKDIPVFMLSVKGKVEDVEDAYKLGADGYVTKPFNLQALGSVIRNKLEKLARNNT